jgi:O-antigen ligase
MLSSPDMARQLGIADASSIYRLIAPAVFLFVLPFAHVTALRSISFAVAVVLAALAIRRLPLKSIPMKVPFVLWAAAALASLLTAIDPAYSLDQIKGDVLYPALAFLVFFVFTNGIREYVFWRSTIAVCLLTLSAIAAVSFHHYGEWRDGYQNDIGEYGMFLLLSFPLLLSAFFSGPLGGGRLERFVVAAALISGIYAGYLSKGRALWLGFIVVALMTTAYVVIRRKAGKAGTLAIAAALIAASLSVAVMVSKQRGVEVTYIDARIPIYALALENISQHPLYGTGFGREANRQAYKRAFPEGSIRHAHNIFLSYAEQMGVWGLFALLALFWTLLTRFWRVARNAVPEMGGIGLTGFSLTTVFLLKGLLDMFFTGHLLLIFWGYAGILLGLAARLDQRSEAAA